MRITTITVKDAEKLFVNLAIADLIDKHYFNHSCEFFMKRVAIELLQFENLWFESFELFKFEITKQLNDCLSNENLTSKYGKPWFAHELNFIKILNIIETEAFTTEDEK